MTNYAKPTLKALRDRAISELNSNIQGADATLRRRVLKVIAIICAAMADEILRRVEYLLKQVFPTEADEQYLIKHGNARNFPRKAASKATGSATFTGCAPGSIVPEGTELKRADNVLYTTTGEDGFITLDVIATDASDNGNADPGTTLTFSTPIQGVPTSGTVGSGGLTGGADIENIEEYRARFLEFIRNPSTGGNKTDYVIWAKEVAGVTRAWCYPVESGPGTVTVRFMMDDTYPDGIPNASDIAAVQSHIADLKPATSTLYVVAPVADPVNITFSRLSPATQAIKQNIEQNLKSLFQSSTNAPGSGIALSAINTAIGKADGVEDFALISPVSNVAVSLGHIPTLGTITYPSEQSHE